MRAFAVFLSLFVLGSICPRCGADTATDTGTVESVDVAKRTITVRRKLGQGEKVGTFSVSPEAELVAGDAEIDLASLKKGDVVALTFDKVAKQLTKIAKGEDEESGGVALFNGKDLDGWITGLPQKGGTQGAWVADPERQVLISPGPTHSNWLETTNAYEDFRLSLEFRTLPNVQPTPNGSGVMVRVMGRHPGGYDPRGIEIDINGDHTGAFICHETALKGKGIAVDGKKRTTIQPLRKAMKPAGEWNKMLIECKRDEIKVTLNDVMVNAGKDAVIAPGKICLRNQGMGIEFRNIRIAEIDGSPKEGAEEAITDANGIELFDGKDLKGWTLRKPRKNSSDTPWHVDRERSVLISPAGTGWNWLETDESYKNFVLSLEYRFPPGGQNGSQGSGVQVRAAGLTFIGTDPRGIEVELQAMLGEEGSGTFVCHSAPLKTSTRESLADAVYGKMPPTKFLQKPVGQWNTLEVECNGERISVKINDELVNEGTGAKIVAGKICLKNQGTSIEFRNIRLRPVTE